MDFMTPTQLWDRKFHIDELTSDTLPNVEQCHTWYSYTDRSRHHNQTGCGFVVPKKGEVVSSFHDYLGTSTTVFQAEVQAIRAAASYFRHHRICIMTDSMLALRVLSRASVNSKLVHQCILDLNALGHMNTVHLEWIKVHRGYAGNELADEQAKIGASSPTIGLEPFLWFPSAHVKQHHNNFYKKRWTTSWSKRTDCRQTKLWLPSCNMKFFKPILECTRHVVGRLVQIITGHCDLMRHRLITQDSDTACCQLLCHSGNETPEHLATDCRWRTEVGIAHCLPTTAWDQQRLRRFLEGDIVEGLMAGLG